jgi:putative phosphoesterase
VFDSHGRNADADRDVRHDHDHAHRYHHAQRTDADAKSYTKRHTHLGGYADLNGDFYDHPDANQHPDPLNRRQMPKPESNTKQIGIISDTHGLLRPEAVQALQGVAVIFHAGDVGDPVILSELGKVAPVHAVRGNMDRGDLFEQLPPALLKECCGVSFYALHDLMRLDINPAASGVDVVIHGHTHNASVEKRKGVWYINPGCAGPNPKRGRASVSVIQVHDDNIKPKIVSI